MDSYHTPYIYIGKNILSYGYNYVHAVILYNASLHHPIQNQVLLHVSAKVSLLLHNHSQQQCGVGDTAMLGDGSIIVYRTELYWTTILILKCIPVLFLLLSESGIQSCQDGHFWLPYAMLSRLPVFKYTFSVQYTYADTRVGCGHTSSTVAIFAEWFSRSSAISFVPLEADIISGVVYWQNSTYIINVQIYTL